MTQLINYKFYFYLTFLLYCIALTFATSLVYSEDSGETLLKADKIEVSNDGNKIKAESNVKIKNSDLTLVSDKIEYDKEKLEFVASGNIKLLDKFNNNYYFNKLLTGDKFNNAIGSNVKIRLKDGARIVGSSFNRTESNVNKIDNATYTPCLKENYVIENCPGWKLDAKRVYHDSNNKNVYYENATLSILNIPVLYVPYFSHPDPSVKKRSGILMPSVADDNTLGTSISVPFFYNISSNKDLTITPYIFSKADNYYNLNYRYLSKNHLVSIDTSITDNESGQGTRSHTNINGDVSNPYGVFNYKIETTNNNTYLRKYYINDLTVLTNSLNFTKETDHSYLSFNSSAYEHLNNSNEKKWEYIYPNVKYNINATDPILKRNWTVESNFLNYKDINKKTKQQISTEIQSIKKHTSYETGLVFENYLSSRLVYINQKSNNYSQLRVFPQIGSKISYPLSRVTTASVQTLEPIIMPVIAPYNNYTGSVDINNGNIFSLNRATGYSQWEGGPRVNYGVNWLISKDTYIINTLMGQSIKLNKNKTDTDDEISHYFIGNSLNISTIGYITTDLMIDKDDFYIKDNNINSSIELGKIKFAFDYDYEAANKIKTSEQISFGAKIRILKDTHLITSIRKDLISDKSIGNSVGLYFENDCLAINFDHYRDFTSISDIKNSRGYSFTITLKPFGTSKQAGKVRNFGPEL